MYHLPSFPITPLIDYLADMHGIRLIIHSFYLRTLVVVTGEFIKLTANHGQFSGPAIQNYSSGR